MKYKKTKLVNYRQQRNNLNILETCTFFWTVTNTEQNMTDTLTLQDKNAR